MTLPVDTPNKRGPGLLSTIRFEQRDGLVPNDTHSSSEPVSFLREVYQ